MLSWTAQTPNQTAMTKAILAAIFMVFVSGQSLHGEFIIHFIGAYNLCVGESDAKTLIYRSPERRPETEHQAEMRDIARQSLESVTVRVFGQPPREVWTGKGYELAAKIENDLFRKKGSAPTPQELTDGYKAACSQFQQKNGHPFTVKNLRDGLQQHRVLKKAKQFPRPRVKASPKSSR
jgi:hypothetical protein